MSADLILLTGYDPDYLRIVETLALRSRETGRNFTVLDVTPIQAGPSHSYSPGLLRLAGFHPPGFGFGARIEELGGQFATADPDLPHEINGLRDDELVELKISVHSALLSFYRTDAPDLSKQRVRRMHVRLTAEGLRAKANVEWFLTGSEFTRVFVPNGRFPGQRISKMVADRLGLEIWHYEKGALPQQFYLRQYSPHARVESQNDASAVLASVEEKDIDVMATEWLTRRLPSRDSRNEFALMMSNSPDKSEPTESPFVVFFTSSQDEFLFLGPEWQLHEWRSQEEAFDHLMSSFEHLGLSIVLRVHPNLASKSHKSFLRTRAGILDLKRKHPGLRVIWHDEPVNSYSLLDRAQGVVVWDSTIGLEANARGLPVWNCAKAYYSMLADTTEILKPQDASIENLEFREVDTSGARRFIAYLLCRDVPISSFAIDWRPWGDAREPFGVQLARIARTGGAPSLLDALSATVDLWRHRSFSHNFKSVSSRLTGR